MTEANDRSNAAPALQVLLSAFHFGAVAFFVGLSLGPIASFFVTGPIGAIIGALWGALFWARGRAVPEVRPVFKWVVGIWIVTLLYTHFIFTKGFSLWVHALALLLQVVLLAGTMFLLLNRQVCTSLTPTKQGCIHIVLASLILLVLMTAFPPVMSPRWVADTQQNSTPLPVVAFLLDSGFDASHHYPRFAINGRVLLLEWLVAISFAFTSCGLIVLAQRIRR